MLVVAEAVVAEVEAAVMLTRVVVVVMPPIVRSAYDDDRGFIIHGSHSLKMLVL
jgi:hypothetical protein